MAKRERKYAWFLEPKSKDVDWSIALGIAEGGEGDTACHMVRCAGGKPHNLLECDKEMCTLVANSRRIGKDFEVWRKEGGGRITNVSFLFRKHRPKRQNRKAPVH